MKKHILFIVFGIVTLISCKKEGCTDLSAVNYSEKATKDDGSCKYNQTTEVGTIILTLNHLWESSNFEMNTNLINHQTGDSIEFTTLKYFISNIQLKDENGNWWAQTESYHLINLENGSAPSIQLGTIPIGNYTEVKFLFGVDSTRNVSGSQTGALSTTSGMFWSWNSGYIMLKAEGLSSSSTTGQFAYHVGGFTGVNSTIKWIQLPLSQSITVLEGQQSSFNVQVELSKMFQEYGSISNGHTIHMPGPNARLMAEGFHNAFSL